MRTKSETRRQAILQAATEVFQEKGFERCAMSDIRERVGYSKPTLYSYFPSKEALFSTVVFEATELEFQATLQALDPNQPDMTQALESFGQRLLTLLYSPQVQAVRRMVVSQSGHSELGRTCYEMGPVRSEAAIASFLQQAMDQGQLRQANPRIAALQLKGLLEAEWIEPFLFNTLSAPDSVQIRETVARAVAVFMAAYGAKPQS
jgi:AcrR family transcriptional regulator